MKLIKIYLLMLIILVLLDLACSVREWSVGMGEREGQSELDLGHKGAGDDCMAQMVKYGGGAAVAGR